MPFSEHVSQENWPRTAGKTYETVQNLLEARPRTRRPRAHAATQMRTLFCRLDCLYLRGPRMFFEKFDAISGIVNEK